MEITTRRLDGGVEVTVKGRLDAYWADHLSAALEEVLREGADRIALDLAGASYLSSVGIRVLLRFRRQLERIDGTFSVSRPSEPVKKVLELAGLQMLLASPTPATVEAPPVRQVEHRGAAFEVFDQSPGATLSCRIVGDPERMAGRRFGVEHCRAVRFPATTLGIGLGAFGSDFADCRGRFGEFLAAGGAAATLPTDGTNVPDYMISSGALVPEVQVLYGVACEGTPAHLLRFETSGREPLALSELAAASLEIAGAERAALVILAQSAGLVGATLRHSPALEEAEGTRFAHPEIRRWLSFAAEHVYARSLVLAVGIAAGSGAAELAPLLRPLGRHPEIVGHFHAAPFSYRPLPKGPIELEASVRTLFEAETLQDVLHLLGDDRSVVGAGESELTRGACWVGPCGPVEREE
jgi:anti-anti-sigma factor